MSATKCATLALCARLDLGLRGEKLFLVPAGDHDVGTGLGEAAGHGLAEPLAPPGHEGHPSRQIKKSMTHENAVLLD